MKRFMWVPRPIYGDDVSTVKRCLENYKISSHFTNYDRRYQSFICGVTVFSSPQKAAMSCVESGKKYVVCLKLDFKNKNAERYFATDYRIFFNGKDVTNYINFA